ncbi:MAG: ABC transporter ATP-binding protein [Thermoleophilia bacterium]|nr:ABC transporter ATP-binding protein [Thermoleophilia bacterium]
MTATHGEQGSLDDRTAGAATAPADRVSRPSATAPPLLAVDSLARSFGGRDVVRSLSLEVPAGERVALAGANGSGKTTVLRCIAGTLLPTRGRISVAGASAGSVEARAATGASLGPERSFYLRLSGRANLLLFARLRGATRSEAAEQVAAIARELEIDGFVEQTADTYSAGMLQQLAFARALLGDPALLILDEPTRSLDTGAIDRFWRALDRRPGSAVLLATHNRDDLERCSKRVELPT